MSEFIRTSLQDGILEVCIDRAGKMNALTVDMYNAMADAIERAGAEREVRVLLFRGSGGVFSAGNDLSDFLKFQEGAPKLVNRFLLSLAANEIPVVAAVEGAAIGVGTTMLMHFDVVYAADDARFCLPFVNLGLAPEAASSALIVSACGYKRAADLLLFGEPFDAYQARDCGIVSEVFPADDVYHRAREAAERLAAKPARSLQATRRLMRRAPESIRERIEVELKVFGELLMSEEAAEAIRAVAEKRKPDFSRFQ